MILLEGMKAAVDSNVRDHQVGFRQDRSALNFNCIDPLETAWPLRYTWKHRLFDKKHIPGNVLQGRA